MMRFSMQVQSVIPSSAINLPTILSVSLTNEEVEQLFGKTTGEDRYVMVSGSWDTGIHVSRCEDHTSRMSSNGVRIINPGDAAPWIYRLGNREGYQGHKAGFNMPGRRIGLPNFAIPSIDVQSVVREHNNAIGLWAEIATGVQVTDAASTSRHNRLNNRFAKFNRAITAKQQAAPVVQANNGNSTMKPQRHQGLPLPVSKGAPLAQHPSILKPGQPKMPVRTPVLDEMSVANLKASMELINQFLAANPEYFMKFTKTNGDKGLELAIMRPKVQIETI